MLGFYAEFFFFFVYYLYLKYIRDEKLLKLWIQNITDFYLGFVYFVFLLSMNITRISSIDFTVSRPTHIFNEIIHFQANLFFSLLSIYKQQHLRGRIPL